MERSARSEGKILENRDSLLHGREALSSLLMQFLHLAERRHGEGTCAVGVGRSKIDHCAFYRIECYQSMACKT